MATPLLSSFAIWAGVPIGIFPCGSHVFAADLDALHELADALRQDLREEHLVPLDVVARAQAHKSVEAFEQEPDFDRPFALRRLRDWLGRRRPPFEQAAHRRIVENTLRHGRARLEHLRALGAAQVLVDATVAELARVEAPGWSPLIEIAPPNSVAVAAIVDVESRARANWPLDLGADVSSLVLIAAQCCVAPDAEALDQVPWIDELEWKPLVENSEDDTPVPPGVVRVRPALYPEGVERIEFAIGPPEHIATRRALLAVAMPMAEEN